MHWVMMPPGTKGYQGDLEEESLGLCSLVKCSRVKSVPTKYILYLAINSFNVSVLFQDKTVYYFIFFNFLNIHRYHLFFHHSECMLPYYIYIKMRWGSEILQILYTCHHPN